MVIKKMYQKEIIYISLYNDGLKEGCVGYLKSEERRGQFRLELQVKNISGSISGDYPLRFQNADGWQDVDTFTINTGNGKWSGSAAGPVFGVEIILSETCMIKGESKNATAHNKVGEEMKPETISAQEQTSSEQQETSIRLEMPTNPPEQASAVTARIEATVPETQPSEWQTTSKLTAQEETMPPPEPRTRKFTSPNMAENPPIYESKWEQLLATYEKIHPYGDDRVYVKLEPKDFVILPAGYQHLVNNSFLLHGFYNYRYLILGKERDFYLGVPGVFYEREKMVALMFGFEAFECEGGNAEEGKFGYYLRKVEL